MIRPLYIKAKPVQWQVKELPTILWFGDGLKQGGLCNILENLGGAPYFLSYSTSNMHINIIVWQRN